MCGIFGVIEDRAGVGEGSVWESVRQLAHRGPDSQGVHVEGGVALGHTRLSLLDLSARGNQPFQDDSGRYSLAYNGEIYNFQELRRELEGLGVQFRTTSDTEVLLHAVIRLGIRVALGKLRGMFAFVLWDREARTLTAARDRFGIKPLLVHHRRGRTLFASEVAAFRPWLELRASRTAMAAFLLGHTQPTLGASLFEGVACVAPGTYVTVEPGGEPVVSRYQHVAGMLDRAQTEQLAARPPGEWIDLLEHKLLEATKSMLFADAPVGALCSGGVDSSLIMAMAARHHGDLAVFHANVAGRFSELSAAKELARHLGLDLKVVDVEDDDFIGHLPEVSRHAQCPVTYHPNSVPFLLVSRLVRQNGVKAVLSGEGADECFLGYQWLAQAPLVNLAESVDARLQALTQRIPFMKGIRRLSQSAPTLAREILSGFERSGEEAQTRRIYEAILGRKCDRNVASALLLGYHLRTLLHRNDTLGMASSIEARFPFLDEEVVALALNLPLASKIRFSPLSLVKAHPFVRDKWLLRKVADRYLPRQLSHRRKAGFVTSAYERMTLDANYFTGSFVQETFELDSAGVDTLTSTADRQELLRLMQLDVWGRVCIWGEDDAAVASRLREHVAVSPE